MKQSSLLLQLIFVFIICNNCKQEESLKIKADEKIKIAGFHFEKQFYKNDDLLVLPSFVIENESSSQLELKDIKIIIRKLYGDTIPVHEYELEKKISLKAGHKTQIDDTPIWKIPGNLEGVFGIYLEYSIVKTTSGEADYRKNSFSDYITFIRISEKPELTLFNIERSEYKGLPIFKLSRGLSAEYSVQKAVASLAGGISHSWAMPLSPVESTPQFLEKSVKETVDFYNRQFGEEAPFETLVISTGIPSAVYLANAVHAPILPLHFLVGVETVKEMKTILNYANNNGYPSYAAIGHDYSISDSIGVAWVKLLNIPAEYIKFINDHKIKNVIFLGYSGNSDGEIQARKVKDDHDKYAPGSIYLMYFAGDMAETYLRQTIHDFDAIDMEELSTISDWESGIITDQTNNFSHSLKEKTGVEQISLLTSDSDVSLWELGTYVTLSYIHKNKSNYETANPLKGISLNPYLIGHPFFETRMGLIPLLYWQSDNANSYVVNRLNTSLKEIILHYFPDTRLTELDFWINSSDNFAGYNKAINMSDALIKAGYQKIIKNDYRINEIWDTVDGMNSPSEKRALLLIESYSVPDLIKWRKSLYPLSFIDLEEMAGLHKEIKWIRK